MDLFEQSLSLEAAEAARFSVGMRAVAQADGHLREAELMLIAAFEEGMPSTVSPTTGAFVEQAVRLAYVQSLVMVALADGKISAEERAVIDTLASEQGMGLPEVERAVLDVSQAFLSHFDGVRVFADARAAIAAELGLTA